MSENDTGEIILNCFYHRKFYDISKLFPTLNKESNFVFLFAEADETRFVM